MKDLKTNTTPDVTLAGELRSWAQGLYPLEAATELLIRSGYAQSWRPWVRDREYGGHWIDFESIPAHTGGMSGGERRLLLLAATLSDVVGAPFSLGDLVSGLDRDKVDLILAAVAHAAGTHEGSRFVYDDDGKPVGVEPITSSLHPWPVTRMNQLPFSPLTLSGLGVLIEEHASVVTHAITQGRQLEPHVRAEASLVLDLCRARTDRVLAYFTEVHAA